MRAALRSEPVRTRRLARDLTCWMVLGCFVLTAPVSFWGYRTVVARAEQKLAGEAAVFAESLADALLLHIWNLDDSAIAVYFRSYPVPDPMVYIQIKTQYGDPIYDYTLSFEKRVERYRRMLVYGDEEIGVIELGLSREEIDADRLHMAKLTFLMALSLAVSIGVLSAVLIRILLGNSLARLIRQLQAVARGDYRSTMPVHHYREIDEINHELNLMVTRIADSTGRLQAEVDERRRAEQALQRMTDHLEELVDRRTAQLRDVNQALMAESMQRRRVQQDIIEISNREQRRIGQDLHDSLCQELAGVAYLADSLQRNLAAKKAPDQGLASQIAALLRESVSHTRRIAKGLNPVGLDAEGLSQALLETAENTQRMFQVDCAFSCRGDGNIFHNSTAIHLYHITREAVHNAIRHGQAKHVSIELETDNAEGRLSIRDDGSGFPIGAPESGGMGLHTMSYRAEMIGGRLLVENAVGGGTVVSVTFDNAAPETK